MSSANLPRQPLSVYSVMLIVSAILMFIACILMALELVAYRPWEASGIPNASRSIPATSSQVSLQRLT